LWLLGRDEAPADTGSVLTYVRWYWPDDDVCNYEELYADRGQRDASKSAATTA
jgi:hypothetical protein